MKFIQPTRLIALILALISFSISTSFAQTVSVVSTLAGSSYGYLDGTGTSAKFASPSGSVVDGSGNLYVSDQFNHRIRKITPSGVVSTFAGNSNGYKDSIGTLAQFSSPTGLAIDSSGNIYVADQGNNRIRMITPAGVVTTLAGSTWGFADGTGTLAQFKTPQGVAIDSANNVYVADYSNHRIRKITPSGVVTTLAGSGSSGIDNGTGTSAQFSYPRDVIVDQSNTIYVADYFNHRIRKVTPAGVVTTFAGSSSGFADGTGTSAQFKNPTGVDIDSAGNLLVADYSNRRIRRITPSGVVSTVAGNGEFGTDDGFGFLAEFGSPVDVAASASGEIYVSDANNYTLRKIVFQPCSHSSSSLTLNVCDSYISPSGKTWTSTNTYIDTIPNQSGCDSVITINLTVRNSSTSIITDTVCDIYTGPSGQTWAVSGTFSDTISNSVGCDSVITINLTVKGTPVGTVSTYAGSTSGYFDSTALFAKFYSPTGVAVDTHGNVFVVDRDNYRIRKISPSGVVTTLAGSGSSGFANGTGTSAQFGQSYGLACDLSGNVYVADGGNNKIRKITPAGVVTTFAGSSQGFADGAGTSAKFYSPWGIVVDDSGYVYVGDINNARIRKITPSGVVSTIAGSGTWGYADGPGNTAEFRGPSSVALDGNGDLYVTDQANYRVRKVTPSGVVSTVAGSGSPGYEDGANFAAKFDGLDGLAIDKSGNIYVSDRFNHVIRTISVNGGVSTLAGSTNGLVDSVGTAAKFSGPHGLAIDKIGNLFVGDFWTQRIRKITISDMGSTEVTISPTVCDSFTTSSGMVLTSTGTYMDTIPNSTGCDSLITINLTINRNTGSHSITACDSYTWDGSTYTSSGVRTKTYTNAAGCDSVHTLNLTINNSNTGSHSITVCDSYTWDGTTYNTSGAKMKTYTNAAGCDSVHTLNLTINGTTFSTISPDVCDSYTSPSGKTWTTSNTYHDTIPNAAGCDSVITVNLTIRDSNTGSHSITACDSYTWDGTTYTTSGAKMKTYTNSANCDSVHTLNLTVNNSNTGSHSITACDSYTWDGTTYTSSGSPTKTYTNAAGCDSVHTLNLTINVTTFATISPDVCDSYTSPSGKTWTTSNTYSDTIPNTAGCDSVITVNLIIRNSSSGSHSITSCDSYTWDGTTYTTSGAKMKTYTNSAGCDSVHTLNLTINNSNTGSHSITACDSYTWDGTSYTTSGAKMKTYTKAAGCDSVHTLNLTINVTTFATISPDVCDSYTSPSGKTWTTSNTYSDTIPNGAGCDSVITVNLTIRNSSSGSHSITACDSYTWDGTSYTTSGAKMKTYTNAAGCDSVHTLNLTINNSNTGSHSITSCDSFTWDGTKYTTSGAKMKTYTNAAGCDSVHTLNLTINNSNTGSHSITACDSYTWDGTTYTSSGAKMKTYTNAAGCDSVHTLNLTINNSNTGSHSITACDSYTWDGTTYTSSGAKMKTYTNAAGCDSVHTLNLTINNSNTGSNSITSCDSFTWDGTKYTTSGAKMKTYTNAAGCDSVHTLNLTINNSNTGSHSVNTCDSFTWDGTTYTTSGAKMKTYTNAAGCDSVHTLNLTLRYASTSTINPDVCDTYTSPSGKTWTTSGTRMDTIPNDAGCDSVITVNLTIRNSTTHTFSVTQYDSYTTPSGATITTSGTVTDVITNDAGCDSTMTIHVTIVERVYVDGDVLSSGNGKSWATAHKTINQALDTANASNNSFEIWVKKGTYYPSGEQTSTNRDLAFVVNNINVRFLGGFSGVETVREQRNPSTNKTILCGDIGVLGRFDR